MMSAATMSIARRLGAATMLLGVLAGCERGPQEFNTPEEAAAALVSAAEKFDRPALKTILGSNGTVLVESGDSVQDRNDAIAFAAEARTSQRLELDSAQGLAVLTVGASDWPLPMPIVKRDGKWSFDAASGQDEILLRRIGRNELDAIDVAYAYVEAQRAYSMVRHAGSLVNQYAQRVVSTPGKQDGLAWQDADGTWRGPVAAGVARAIAEGYNEKTPTPYHGYYYKVLKGQGPAAPLGEMDFMVDGAMIGGFALVAAPAEYLVTGVQTFMVSHDGIVYEKDLGEQTLAEFRKMERYNPDSTWTAGPRRW